MTVMFFFDNHYRPLRLRGRSPETSRLYRISIRHFDETMGRDAVLTDLTNENINRHLQRIRDKGRAPATVNKDLSQLGAIWRFASRHGHVGNWPEVRKEIEPKRVPMAWTPQEVRQLLATIEAMAGMLGNVAERSFWGAIVRLCLDTGERIGAVRVAQWDWLNDDWLIVPAESRKGKTRDRAYQLSPHTMELLGELRKAAIGSTIFYFPREPGYLWRRLAHIQAKAGLPVDRRSKWHRMRRTVATAVHASGGDAQAAMDHSSRKTTDSYIDPRATKTVANSSVVTDYLGIGKAG